MKRNTHFYFKPNYQQTQRQTNIMHQHTFPTDELQSTNTIALTQQLHLPQTKNNQPKHIDYIPNNMESNKQNSKTKHFIHKNTRSNIKTNWIICTMIFLLSCYIFSCFDFLSIAIMDIITNTNNDYYINIICQLNIILLLFSIYINQSMCTSNIWIQKEHFILIKIMIQFESSFSTYTRIIFIVIIINIKIFCCLLFIYTTCMYHQYRYIQMFHQNSMIWISFQLKYFSLCKWRE